MSSFEPLLICLYLTYPSLIRLFMLDMLHEFSGTRRFSSSISDGCIGSVIKITSSTLILLLSHLFDLQNDSTPNSVFARPSSHSVASPPLHGCPKIWPRRQFAGGERERERLENVSGLRSIQPASVNFFWVWRRNLYLFQGGRKGKEGNA